MTATLIFFNEIPANFSTKKKPPLYDSPAQKANFCSKKKTLAADILTLHFVEAELGPYGESSRLLAPPGQGHFTK
jgi:hypothetical protein